MKQNDRKKRFLQHLPLYFVAAVILAAIFLETLTILLNRKSIQSSLLAQISKISESHLEIENAEFQLLLGSVAGDHIVFDHPTSGIHLEMNKFRLNTNPLWLLLGKVKITSIQAEHLSIDTIQLRTREPDPNLKPPAFLNRIKLKNALIKDFVWKKDPQTTLTIEKMNIETPTGSFLLNTPSTLTAKNINFTEKKLSVHVDLFSQNGFFLININEKNLLDESRFLADISWDGLLMSFRKAEKPWLTDEGWDADLSSILTKYYPNGIPKDQSYLYIPKGKISFIKKEHNWDLKSFSAELWDAEIVAKGNYNSKTGQTEINLRTLKPTSLSKMPLGQSKLRQSFEKFSLDFNAKGKIKNLNENDLKLNLTLSLLGNRVVEKGEDLHGELSGKLVNSKFVSDKINIFLGQGSLTGQTEILLENLTTKTLFESKAIDLHTILRLFSAQNIPSLVSGSGSLTGNLKNPTFHAEISAEDAGYEFLHFGPVNAKISIENNEFNMTADTSKDVMGTSHCKLNIKNIFDSGKQIIDLKLSHQKVNVKSLLQAQRLSGVISGTFELKKDEKKLSGSGDFTTSDFHFFGYPIGNISSKVTLKEKELFVEPIRIDLLNPQITLNATRGVRFVFDPQGYTLDSKMLDGLDVKGTFKKASRPWLDLEFNTNHFALTLLTQLIPISFSDSSLTSNIKLHYNMDDPLLSSMQSQIKNFLLKTDEGTIQLKSATQINYTEKSFHFYNSNFSLDNSQFLINGNLGIGSTSNLNLKGALDLGLLANHNPLVSDSDKPIEFDINLKGEINKPSLYGSISFKDDSIEAKNLSGDLNKINGSIQFDGNKIIFKKLHALYDDSPLTIDGFFYHSEGKTSGGNLNIQGKELNFHPTNDFNFLADINLNFSGTSPVKLSGTFNILEGIYTQNYGITNFIIKPTKTDGESSEDNLSFLPEETAFDVQIKNTGDVAIHNNLLNVDMSIDLNLLGTLKNPALNGQVDFSNGSINTFGISFENASGFAQFQKKNGVIPYLSLSAKKQIQQYEVAAKISGSFDNLKLDLDSIPSLDRREILSIIAYGQTPEELTGDERKQFSQAVALSQIASILSRPVYHLSGLDVLQVNSRRETINQSVQRFTIGKKISKRFHIAFTTDLGVEDPERAIEMEYQVLDNFFLTFAKDFGERLRFDLKYRFEMD